MYLSLTQNQKTAALKSSLTCVQPLALGTKKLNSYIFGKEVETIYFAHNLLKAGASEKWRIAHETVKVPQKIDLIGKRLLLQIQMFGNVKPQTFMSMHNRSFPKS